MFAEAVRVAVAQATARGTFKSWLRTLQIVPVPAASVSASAALAAAADSELQVAGLDPLRMLQRVDHPDRNRAPKGDGGKGDGASVSPWTRSEPLSAYARLVSEVSLACVRPSASFSADPLTGRGNPSGQPLV